MLGHRVAVAGSGNASGDQPLLHLTGPPAILTDAAHNAMMAGRPAREQVEQAVADLFAGCALDEIS
ncbi:hypothetical protein [Actinokineospora sp. HUAS TT18]|uniref:hypothetical protein n=1 Tax=Actinokineospora sp. HUAS TT18 TaxID=3447451 RepID=UPI003F52170B